MHPADMQAADMQAADKMWIQPRDVNIVDPLAAAKLATTLNRAREFQDGSEKNNIDKSSVCNLISASAWQSHAWIGQ